MKTHSPTQRRTDDGFSLIELLITVTIIAVLAAIAIPLYTSQKEKASLVAAESDARGIGMEIISTISDYTSTGVGGPITITGDSVAIEIGASHVPLGLPDTPTTTARLSPDSTLAASSSVKPFSSVNEFCLRVDNAGQTAIFTQDGLQPAATDCDTGTAI
jgi:prepilin-type N-terminal cleavage/methylation domain-containing protein